MEYKYSVVCKAYVIKSKANTAKGKKEDAKTVFLLVIMDSKDVNVVDIVMDLGVRVCNEVRPMLMKISMDGMMSLSSPSLLSLATDTRLEMKA